MITDPRAVRLALRARILTGYQPQWSEESADDHDVDWQAISRCEFETITADAKVRLQRLGPLARRGEHVRARQASSASAGKGTPCYR